MDIAVWVRCSRLAGMLEGWGGSDHLRPPSALEVVLTVAYQFYRSEQMAQGRPGFRQAPPLWPFSGGCIKIAGSHVSWSSRRSATFPPWWRDELSQAYQGNIKEGDSCVCRWQFPPSRVGRRAAQSVVLLGGSLMIGSGVRAPSSEETKQRWCTNTHVTGYHFTFPLDGVNVFLSHLNKTYIRKE